MGSSVWSILSTSTTGPHAIMAERGSKPCGGRRIDVEWTGCVGWDGRDRLLFSSRVGGGLCWVRDREMDGGEGWGKYFTVRCATVSGSHGGKCGCLKFGRVKRGRTKSYSQTDQVVKGTHKRNVRWSETGGSSRVQERVVRKSSARRSKPLPSWFATRPLAKHPPLSFHPCTPLPKPNRGPRHCHRLCYHYYRHPCYNHYHCYHPITTTTTTTYPKSNLAFTRQRNFITVPTLEVRTQSPANLII